MPISSEWEKDYVQNYHHALSSDGIPYEQLSSLKVEALDQAIAVSGVLADDAFNVRPTFLFERYEATSAPDARDFLEKALSNKLCEDIVLCDDTGDIGFKLSLDDFLKEFEKIHSFRHGHLYICSVEFKLLAIVKLPLWVETVK